MAQELNALGMGIRKRVDGQKRRELDFVSTVGEDIARVFAAVLAICDRQGLIGREMFAIDGVKLPSNAAKSRSGTRADFERQATKLEAAAQTMLQRHREADAQPTEPALAATEVKRIERLHRDAAQIRGWLAQHPEDRRGVKGLAPQEQPHRQRERQDGYRQRCHSGLHRSGGGRRRASDHRRGSGARHRLRAGTVVAGGDGDAARTCRPLGHHRRRGVSQ